MLPSELIEAGVRPRALQPLAGRIALDGNALCFIPRFPFIDGTSYALLFDPVPEESAASNREVWTIRRPARQEAPATDVVAIYPSGDALPVNQLKLYVHFSGPMSEGWAARAIHVRRASDGVPLDGVFLVSATELWDRQHRRLTLLLDPGRIKRGLVPNEEAGYPLTEGVPVVVTVDIPFRDATGRPLQAGVEQRYQVTPPVRARIDPRAWQYDYPRAGSTEPLTLTFDRPLDHALLGHCLWVHDAAGAPLAGRGVIDAGERSWRFEPQSPWEQRRYLAIVDPRLEDLAGNSLIRVFDRDLTRAEDSPVEARQVAIEFTCVPPATHCTG